jgi:hypothetical protein
MLSYINARLDWTGQGPSQARACTNGIEKELDFATAILWPKKQHGAEIARNQIDDRESI